MLAWNSKGYTRNKDTVIIVIASWRNRVARPKLVMSFDSSDEKKKKRHGHDHKSGR